LEIRNNQNGEGEGKKGEEENTFVIPAKGKESLFSHRKKQKKAAG